MRQGNSGLTCWGGLGGEIRYSYNLASGDLYEH